MAILKLFFIDNASTLPLSGFLKKIESALGQIAKRIFTFATRIWVHIFRVRKNAVDIKDSMAKFVECCKAYFN